MMKDKTDTRSAILIHDIAAIIATIVFFSGITLLTDALSVAVSLGLALTVGTCVGLFTLLFDDQFV